MKKIFTLGVIVFFVCSSLVALTSDETKSKPNKVKLEQLRGKILSVSADENSFVLNVLITKTEKRTLNADEKIISGLKEGQKVVVFMEPGTDKVVKVKLRKKRPKKLITQK